MKLLIITQKVESTDPILGFFHRWIEEFAAHVDHVTVIGQAVGAHTLPSTVSVHSLGKEKKSMKIGQILRFWSLLWKLRREYDTVFVHMTPIWVLLGAPLWIILRKPIFLWYEARGGGWVLPLALPLARRVFSATDYGLPRKTVKRIITGHGIDVDRFTPSPSSREQGLIVTAGRTTRTKHLEHILSAFKQLPSSYRLFVAGGPITPEDHRVLAALREQMEDLGISNRVVIDWVDPANMPGLLQKADLVLHACGGGLDKIVLETMACGTPIISSSFAARVVLPSPCVAENDTLAEKATQILSLSQEERSSLAADLRQRVKEHHSVSGLIRELITGMRTDQA
jgi:glycosyltransferase involved in cell wall biosynthesis